MTVHNRWRGRRCMIPFALVWIEGLFIMVLDTSTDLEIIYMYIYHWHQSGSCYH